MHIKINANNYSKCKKLSDSKWIDTQYLAVMQRTTSIKANYLKMNRSRIVQKKISHSLLVIRKKHRLSSVSMVTFFIYEDRITSNNANDPLYSQARK